MNTVICFDTETALIRPGRTAPPISCLTFQAVIDGRRESVEIVVYLPAIKACISSWLEDDDVILVGHNVAFDLAVIGAEWPDLVADIFAKYEKDLVTDTMIREKLSDIAKGEYRGRFDSEGKYRKHGYTLQELARRKCGIPIKKEGFRMFYGPLRGVPLDGWAEAARALQDRGRLWLQGLRDDVLDRLAADFGDLEGFEKEVRGMVEADPGEVVSYPLDDARATLDVYLAQRHVVDEHPKARDAWRLHLMSAWGLCTEGAAVARLQVETQEEIAEIEQELIDAGLVKKNGSRDTKAATQRMLDVCGWRWDEGLGEYVANGDDSIPLRLTDGGKPSLDSDACKATDDELLKHYAELTSLKKVLSADIAMLARATRLPVHSRFDMAETGRTTSSKPNIQNFSRKGGIRECWVPRHGYVFAQADYSSLELVTLAQACIDLLGESKLAEAINDGKDVHTMMACTILGGIPYEEGVRLKKAKDPKFDDARQTAKVANFGFPGGLGAEKLVLFARKTYGVVLTVDEARALKARWLETWPEMRAYFAYVSALGLDRQALGDAICELADADSDRARKLNGHGFSKETTGNGHYYATQIRLGRSLDASEWQDVAWICRLHARQVGKIDTLPIALEQLRSGRVRGGCTYTSACNSFFQGLGADATSYAGWLLAKACYADPSSPLYGSRVVAFVHDEYILETPDDARAHDVAVELERIMVEGAKAWLPDVRIEAPPLLMRRWSKEAVAIVENGRLVPWAPKEEAA